MTKLKSIANYKLVLMLAPLVISMPFAMDIYTPALPEISSLFQVTAATMQWTLSAFLIMFAFLQLFFGPLSDRFGRRKIGVLCCLIYAAGNLNCALAHNIGALLAGRLLQAAGTCGMLVSAFAIVRDTHNKTQAAKCYSHLNGMIAFSPLCAPFIGSYLDTHLGWPSTFFALQIIALTAICCLYKLPLKVHPIKAFYNSKTWWQPAHYSKVIAHKDFLSYTFVNAASISFLFLFCSLSPYLILRQLKISEAYYGYYFAVMGVSILLGSWLCSRVVSTLGLYRTIMLGSSLSLLGGLSMYYGYSMYGLKLSNWLWPMLAIGAGGTISMGAASAGAMQPFPKHAGTAAAIFGTISYLLPPLTASIMIRSATPSSMALAGPAICYNSTILVLFYLRRKQLKRHS